jgi:hypothetical protein
LVIKKLSHGISANKLIHYQIHALLSSSFSSPASSLSLLILPVPVCSIICEYAEAEERLVYWGESRALGPSVYNIGSSFNPNDNNDNSAKISSVSSVAEDNDFGIEK